MQVQILEQTIFKILILGKSRFPPKKFRTSTVVVDFIQLISKTLLASMLCKVTVIMTCDQCYKGSKIVNSISRVIPDKKITNITTVGSNLRV